MEVQSEPANDSEQVVPMDDPFDRTHGGNDKASSSDAAAETPQTTLAAICERVTVAGDDLPSQVHVHVQHHTAQENGITAETTPELTVAAAKVSPVPPSDPNVDHSAAGSTAEVQGSTQETSNATVSQVARQDGEGSEPVNESTQQNNPSIPVIILTEPENDGHWGDLREVREDTIVPLQGQ